MQFFMWNNINYKTYIYIYIYITGAGGSGKTTTAISLCYHRIVKEQFTDGFVFIELGPQPTDPSIKLNQLRISFTNW